MGTILRERRGMAITLRSLLLLLLLCSPLWAQPSLSVSGNPYQGSVLFVRVAGDEGGAAPTVTWEGKSWKLCPGSEGWETVLAVGIDSSGPKPLKVQLADGSALQRTIKVMTRDYGHQSISLSESTLAGYDDPQNKADDDAILRALLADTRERLFGDFIYPVDAPQSSGFGLKRTYNGWKKGWHKGLDLAGYEGDTVVAPADGVVLHTALGVVNGNTIVLSHGDGVGSSYFHLSRIDVRQGQTVRQGDPIGAVGGTGGFSPHLHWEMRVHGVPVHPQAFFAIPAAWR